MSWRLRTATALLALIVSIPCTLFLFSRWTEPVRAAETAITAEVLHLLDERAEKRHRELLIAIETVRRQVWRAHGKEAR